MQITPGGSFETKGASLKLGSKYPGGSNNWDTGPDGAEAISTVYGLVGGVFPKLAVSRLRKRKCKNNLDVWSNVRAYMSNLGNISTPARSYLSYFRPTKFKTHYVAPQFPSLICAHISLLA